MSIELPLRCTCGELRGLARDVGPSRGVRLTCYCRDCQTYAWFLGRADELLDPHGGTEVFQLAPARVDLTHGHDRLACVRLSPNGLMRWYAGCCNTPVANTLDRPGVPFVGLVSSFWDPAVDQDARDARLGPRRARVNGPGHPGPDGTMVAIDRLPMGTIMHSLRMLAGAWIRREHRPSPFFEPDTGVPRVTPHVLTKAERTALLDQLPAPAR